MLYKGSNVMDNGQKCRVDRIEFALASRDQSVDRDNEKVSICSSEVRNPNQLR